MDAAELRSALDEVARGEGFDLVGVAAAGPLPRDGGALAQWLASGRHASM